MGRIEAQYLYTTPAATPVALKVRTADKRFFLKAARFKNDRLYWKPGKGCLEKYQPDWADRLLFNLPVLLDALTYGEPVFLVEGERDALALNTIKRLPATTSHLGAKKFTSAQAEWFLFGKGRSPVHIIRDNDVAGAWCAWERYARLVGVGVEPSRIRLWVPEAGDVTETLEIGARRGRRRVNLRREQPDTVQRIHMAEGAHIAARDYTRRSA